MKEKDNYNKFIGKWISALPFDSDDYIAEYEIKGNSENPDILGKDSQDGENFVIKNISFDGDILSFESLMPSSNRKGINKLKITNDNEIDVEFTFTVTEKLKRIIG